MKTTATMENNKILKELASKADKLFQLGSKMKLSEEKISECAGVSLQRKIKYVQPRRSICRTAVLGVVSVLVVSIVLLAVTEAPIMLESTFNRICFDTIRIVRIAMIPLLPTTGADEFIDPECAVPNPLYYKATDCNSCAGVRDVVLLSGTPQHTVNDAGERLITGIDILSDIPLNANRQKVFTFDSILLHKNSSPLVSIRQLRTVIHDYKSDLGNSTLECEPGGFLPVTQLLRSRVNIEETSCVWSSKLDLRVTRVMRRLFPRPSLLPQSTEVALKKVVYIDGPGSGERTIGEGFIDYLHTWYVQTQGERTLEFVPLEECKDTCHRVTTRVQAGDSVIFPSQLWTVKVLENGKEASLGFESYLSI